MAQVAALRTLTTSVRVVVSEGDSYDNTQEALRREAQKQGLSLDLRNGSHGGPHYGSTEHPERMTLLSHVGNVILDGVTSADDVLVYVESDLVWRADTILRLCERVYTAHDGFDVLSPLIFAGELFYDVWAFRGLDGQRFSPFVPYHSDLNGEITEVGSVGSCMIMRAEVASNPALRMTDGALVEWCNNARSLGCRIGVVSSERIYHP